MAAAVDLDDKYALREGRVFLTGIQALVRLPMEQTWLDREAGLNTAGYITGYRGSPLGGYDQALWRAEKRLKALDLRFEPALNEDLAATALVGTQQIGQFDKATRAGVFGLWFGKNPGLDRSGDAIRHGNSIGTNPRGGVLAVVGDDHAAKSSDTCNQCEPSLMALRVPVLAPVDIEEVIDFGLFGWAMSRYSGLWAGLKVLPHHMDCAASVRVRRRPPFILPSQPPAEPTGIAWPDDRFRQEERLLLHRLPAAQAFARANGLDAIPVNPPSATMGIVAAGKAYQDVLQALTYLGLGRERLAELGVRLYKPGLVWPLEPETAREFARGLRSIVVVEEKAPIIETQLRDLFYNEPADRRPAIMGKKTLKGASLFPELLELDPVSIARSLSGIMLEHRPGADIETVLGELQKRVGRRAGPAEAAPRIPYFCAGCPHSRSLKTPEGSRALGGIGCHWMAVWTPEMKTEPALHMGGEGANWIGQAPFSTAGHVFQNLGDGTYYHSGSLAIRAAVAASVNITYKILYNDAIAMTGGQPVEGRPSVERIAAQLRAEGVRRIDVVAEEPERLNAGELRGLGVGLWAREDLLTVEDELRKTPGVTALIFDQVCAAEKRRRRKRGLAETPAKRLYINSDVCEGCGDCGVQSNCVAIEPLETDLGRKRRINPSACNQDFSCQDGFCPSFVSVEARETPGIARRLPDDPGPLPAPAQPAVDRPWGIVITGIGGTGVVTVGALIGMAAHIDGLGVSVLDSIGLAQKNGAVVSYVKIARTPEDVGPARIALGEADALLGCDIVVAGGAEALDRLNPARGRAVVNAHVAPTAQFVHDPDLVFDGAATARRIAGRLSENAVSLFDAHALAEQAFGDALAANLLIVGYAWQKGLIPVSHDAIMKAVRLNGVSVAMNERAFAIGRKAALDVSGDAAAPSRRKELAELVEQRARMLVDYQDDRYAERYRVMVGRARMAAGPAAPDGGDRFARAVAVSYFKLLAYKDEYEVARLLSRPAFRQEVKAALGGTGRMSYHLAPPLLAALDPATGRPRKMTFGPWLGPVLGLLARFKGLRGTPLDPFGHMSERRWERRLIADFESMTSGLIDAGLTSANLDAACRAVDAFANIRGFGPVKEASAARALGLRDRALADFASSRPGARAGEEAGGQGHAPAGSAALQFL